MLWGLSQRLEGHGSGVSSGQVEGGKFRRRFQTTNLVSNVLLLLLGISAESIFFHPLGLLQ